MAVRLGRTRERERLLATDSRRMRAPWLAKIARNREHLSQSPDEETGSRRLHQRFRKPTAAHPRLAGTREPIGRERATNGEVWQVRRWSIFKI
jgi:hypothetical protein